MSRSAFDFLFVLKTCNNVSHQYQDEPDGIIRIICNVLDTEDADYIAGSLPKCAHCDDPAVAFTVDDGLGNVGDKSEAKEDGEEVCSSGVWAEAWPCRVWICLSRAASHCRLQM